MTKENTLGNYKQPRKYWDAPKQNYSPFAALEKETQKQFCPACETSGQLCSKHLKSDKKIVSIADLLAGVTREGTINDAAEQKNMYHQIQAVYAAIISDSLPKQFVMAKQVLEQIAVYHAKQAGLEGAKLYSNPIYADKVKSYSNLGKSEGYLPQNNLTKYNKN